MSGAIAGQYRQLPIDKIEIGERQRSFDPSWAAAIAATLDTMGLKQPIEVAAEHDGYRLIAGRHRLEAAKRAGWSDIPARIVRLDGKQPDASAALAEAMENLMRRELTALDRMAHLSAAKAAHDALYQPNRKGGRPRTAKTRAGEENREIFSQFSFGRAVAEQCGFSKRLVNQLIQAYEGLDTRSRMRLQGSAFADRQSEIMALSRLPAVTQSLVLDLVQNACVTSVQEALAIIEKRDRPDAATRRIDRYARTLNAMEPGERDRIFDAAEAAVRDYAARKGWL